MQKLSGLVLDRYDTPAEWRRFLCNSRPGYDELDKIAHVFTEDELNRLPDDTFALILQDGDLVMKKFSMADAGNTALSLVHFAENAHKLPEEAQKVAAANLVKGCGWYGIPVPETVEKVAFGAMGVLNAALMAPGAVRESKANLSAVQGTGGGIMTPEQIKARRMQTMGA
jgi:hypothetical protein